MLGRSVSMAKTELLRELQNWYNGKKNLFLVHVQAWHLLTKEKAVVSFDMWKESPQNHSCLITIDECPQMFLNKFNCAIRL